MLCYALDEFLCGSNQHWAGMEFPKLKRHILTGFDFKKLGIGSRMFLFLMHLKKLGIHHDPENVFKSTRKVLSGVYFLNISFPIFQGISERLIQIL